MLYYINYRDDDGDDHELTSTGERPFYLADESDCAADLQPIKYS